MGQDALVFEVIRACEDVVDQVQGVMRRKQLQQAEKQHRELLRVLGREK